MDYDIAVIGGGPGGYVAAIRGAQCGARVALVEKEVLGGVCLNRGCIPTKTLLKTAYIANELRSASTFGVDTGAFAINYPTMNANKKKVVASMVKGIETLLKSNQIETIFGEATIAAPGELSVGKQLVSAKNIIIAIGSRPFMLPIPGCDGSSVYTSDEVIAHDITASSWTIVGGGVIGIEMAFLFSSLGNSVTLLEVADRIAPMMEPEVSETLTSMLSRKGVSVVTEAAVESISQEVVTYRRHGRQTTCHSQKILMAVGRRSNADSMPLDKLGIRHANHMIQTDLHMKTSVAGIYAAGDVNGKHMLAHVASREGIVAAENAMGLNSEMDYTAVPNCIYTEPGAASAGMTTSQAIAAGFQVKSSFFPVSINGKAATEGVKEGFVKMLFDATYGQILGVHIVAPHAAELIAQCAMAMSSELTAHEMKSALYPHPSYSEILGEAAYGFWGKHLHLPAKP